MTHALSAGSFAIALVCICAAPAYARGGHGHAHAHAYVHAHAHHSVDHVTSFRTHVTVDHVGHRATANGECRYERGVCAEECRLAGAAVCERCNQEVAMCERAAY